MEENVKKVLVIGSGPIVIGQSAEFDYSGSQACASLREEGIKVVLVNSNPATIQTDKEIADVVYIEPLRVEFIEKIIEAERPDGLIATVGGQTALNLAVELHKRGALQKYRVKLLGTCFAGIEKAEDRKKFAETMKELGEPILEGIAAGSIDEALEFADKHQYPLILRPAYTLGGTGGGIAHDRDELVSIVSKALRASPVCQVLVEESVIGWGEFEYEVIRDSYDNCITICSMENIDPMGVHTGESIVVAPAQTLSDRDHQMLRSAAIRIVRALDVKGGCNVQFALNQKTGEYAVIEVNPRLSRSSALASKATGYPIARVAAKIALGYPLHEIKNAVTKTTSAAFEPALDYVVLKIPRWPFDKMPEGERTLGTQMKSTGEVMAIGRTFEESLGKAIRSLEIKEPKIKDDELLHHLTTPTDLRLFAIFKALRNGMSNEEIGKLTNINQWFISKFENVVGMEKLLKQEELGRELLLSAKRLGFSDRRIAEIIGMDESAIREIRKKYGITPVYKMVDTCAGEFDARTPYYYSTYEQENESIPTGRRKVVIIGGGPIRIGQGIEFDYCCCHASFALRGMGIESIMINNNPETVSTDFDASDRLYFEPLTFEDVLNVIEHERPEGVIVQFGGQTSINLAMPLANAGVKILGTDVEGIDIAEDRERFRHLLKKLHLNQPANGTATNEKEAEETADRISYPIVVRPSYVIAGRGMRVVHDREELMEYIKEAVDVSEKRPVLIEKYIEHAMECEIDGISDGKDLFIGGIMEHIERAGVHSGDASTVVPPVRLKKEVQREIADISKKIALELKNIGAINIQYVVQHDIVYVLEANPRGSRTIPYLSKAIGIPLANMATKVIMGSLLADLGLNETPKNSHYAVKSVVFPFSKLSGVDSLLGPEMKSTGESMGIAEDFSTAYYKSLLGANLLIPLKGDVLISLKDGDKERGGRLARSFKELGFNVSATNGTAAYMDDVEVLLKIGEGEPNMLSKIETGRAQLIVNTPDRERRSHSDGFRIRRSAIEHNIPCITSFEAAEALAEALRDVKEKEVTVKPIDSY